MDEGWNGWVGEWMDGWVDGRKRESSVPCCVGNTWIDGKAGGWASDWKDGWTAGQVAASWFSSPPSHSTPFLTSKAPSHPDRPCQGPPEGWASLVSSLAIQQLPSRPGVGLCDGQDSGPGAQVGVASLTGWLQRPAYTWMVCVYVGSPEPQ